MSSAAAIPVPETPEKKSSGGFMPMLLVGLLSTTLAAGAVLGAGFWLLRSGKFMPAGASAPGAAKAAEPAAAAAEGKSSAELPPSKVMALDPMVVNLSDAGGRAYLRASISLRIADEGEKKAEKEGKPDAAAVAGKTAALRDTTLSVLGEQTSDGLLNPGGVPAVKKRLRERYALDNPEVHVLDVYFTDFLVQRG